MRILIERRWSTAISVMALSLVGIAALTLAACGGSSSTTSNSPGAATSLVGGQSQGAIPLPAPTVTGTIAFAKVVEQGVSDDMYVVSADGTSLTQLTDDLGYEDHPDWSPDGSRILYTHYRKLKGEDNWSDANVWVMNADGSGKVQLTKHLTKGDLWDMNATWSPDGKQIAFNRVRFKKMSVDVFVMNADGGGIKLVTTRPHPMPVWEAWRPSWTPDGKILYLDYDGNPCAVNLDGSGRVRLTEGRSGREYDLSPDGKTIAIYDLTWDRVEAVATRGGETLATLLDPVKDFITGNSMDKYDWADLAWAPDGKVLALASNNDGVPRGSRLYIVNADGSGLSAVPGVDAATCPAWRPE